MKIWIAAFLLLLLAPAALSQSAPNELADAANDRLSVRVIYTPAYVGIDYPNGDVPAHTGVCTDVIIRSYRAAYDFDLQRAVHEDMKVDFTAYPSARIWGLNRPDKNIDHRRVPNLEAYFKRQGASLPRTLKAEDYKPGDVVSWRLGGRIAHIGIVSTRKSRSGTPLIIHNIGAGVKEDDILFASPITGHFRFAPPQ